MRAFFLFIVLIVPGASMAQQSFYEKIMEMNITNADTSTDIMTLERAAFAMERVSKGVKNSWPAAYHIAFCFVKITDLYILKKDTLMAKTKWDMAETYLRRADTIDPKNPENRFLSLYHKINEMRLKKKDKKEMRSIELLLEITKGYNATNPRIYLVNAYFYKCFFNTNKSKRKKALELLELAGPLFEQEKPVEFAPKWGKKWMGELKAELSAESSKKK